MQGLVLFLLCDWLDRLRYTFWMLRNHPIFIPLNRCLCAQKYSSQKHNHLRCYMNKLQCQLCYDMIVHSEICLHTFNAIIRLCSRFFTALLYTLFATMIQLQQAVFGSNRSMMLTVFSHNCLRHCHCHYLERSLCCLNKQSYIMPK